MSGNPDVGGLAPEPWDATGEYVYDSNNRQVHLYALRRRIAACVNACAGMADPEKEIAALRANLRPSPVEGAERNRLCEILAYILNNDEGREFFPRNLDGSPNELFGEARALLGSTPPPVVPGEITDTELRRWQDEIRDLLCKLVPDCNLDGAGCDSGDPLDLTLAEIRKAFNHLKDGSGADTMRVDWLESENGFPVIVESHGNVCDGRPRRFVLKHGQPLRAAIDAAIRAAMSAHSAEKQKG